MVLIRPAGWSTPADLLHFWCFHTCFLPPQRAMQHATCSCAHMLYLDCWADTLTPDSVTKTFSPLTHQPSLGAALGFVLRAAYVHALASVHVAQAVNTSALSLTAYISVAISAFRAVYFSC
jgi:hypothetical protein